jgi:hypothetical protein
VSAGELPPVAQWTVPVDTPEPKAETATAKEPGYEY